MKYALGLLGIIVAAAIIVPSAQASTDFCSQANRCTAATSEDHVSLASIRTNKDTRAVWRLTCEQGSNSTVQKGAVGKGGKRLVTPELSNPDCTLVARGRAPGKTAVVRIALR